MCVAIFIQSILFLIPVSYFPPFYLFVYVGSTCAALPLSANVLWKAFIELGISLFLIYRVPFGSFSSWPFFFFCSLFFFYPFCDFSILSFDFKYFIHVLSQTILVSEVLGGFILLFLRSVEPCSWWAFPRA